MIEALNQKTTSVMMYILKEKDTICMPTSSISTLHKKRSCQIKISNHSQHNVSHCSFQWGGLAYNVWYPSMSERSVLPCTPLNLSNFLHWKLAFLINRSQGWHLYHCRLHTSTIADCTPLCIQGWLLYHCRLHTSTIADCTPLCIQDWHLYHCRLHTSLYPRLTPLPL